MRTSAIRSQPDDRNFEAIFEIPHSHRLVQVRSKTRGGIMSANYWRHDEYGSDGKLAARYESFEAERRDQERLAQIRPDRPAAPSQRQPRGAIAGPMVCC